MNPQPEYKIHLSDKTKSEEGKYQLLEKTDNGFVTCGVYFNKKDVIADYKRLSLIY